MSTGDKLDMQEWTMPIRHAPWLGEIIPGEVPLTDLVDHPPHYTKGKIEVIDAIEGMGLADDYHLAAAVKYIARCRHKGNVEQDIRKAIWYLERKLRKGEL